MPDNYPPKPLTRSDAASRKPAIFAIAEASAAAPAIPEMPVEIAKISNKNARIIASRAVEECSLEQHPL